MKDKLGEHFLSRMDTEYPTWGRQQVTILPLREIVQTSLFQRYMNIPLFRQMWNQHETIMHKYVSSVLFQQFWTVEGFAMYFKNPILFHKYIVPQLQVIAETMTEYNYDSMYPSIMEEEQMFPSTYAHNKYQFPMNQQFEGLFNSHKYQSTPVNYKFLLDKIYKHLNLNNGFVNKVGQIEETLTDVKMLPNGQVKEHTYGKIVNPFTGAERVTVGDIKLVDEKMVMPVEKTMMDYPVYGNKMMKDAILKKMYLNKIFGNKMYTPEYQTIKNMYNPEYQTIKNIFTPEYETVFGVKNMKNIYSTPYETIKNMYTPEESIFGMEKNMYTPEYQTIKNMYNPEHQTIKNIFTPEYETIFKNKNVFVPEYETLKNKMFNTVNMYDNEFVPETNTYKYMSPLVQRMMGVNKINKVEQLEKLLMVLPTEKKMELLKKIQTEKMIDEITKKNLIEKYQTEKMIKGDFYNVVKDNTMELPTMTETEKFQHIPLTFGKPVVGSGINEFENQEIKY
jgi:hypothetical protein